VTNPSISVVRTPTGVVAPGTQLTFTVTATDADARMVSFTFTGTDSLGGVTTVAETITVSDPVDVTATVSDPENVATTPQRDAANLSVWRATV
jgi:hypothetical protein